MAAWTLQQLHEAIPAGHAYRFHIHDRDRIFSQLQELDQQGQHPGLRVLKTPARSPQANALRARLLGMLRRQCLDFLIPLTENHMRHPEACLARILVRRVGGNPMAQWSEKKPG